MITNNTTGLATSWILLSLFIASLGRNRKIGFGRALLICLILSPLIGLIFVLISEKHSESLLKLKIGHDSGSLTEEEYNKEVRKIVPNKEDKKNMWIGWGALAVAGLIVYLIVRFLG